MPPPAALPGLAPLGLAPSCWQSSRRIGISKAQGAPWAFEIPIRGSPGPHRLDHDPPPPSLTAPPKTGLHTGVWEGVGLGLLEPTRNGRNEEVSCRSHDPLRAELWIAHSKAVQRSVYPWLRMRFLRLFVPLPLPQRPDGRRNADRPWLCFGREIARDRVSRGKAGRRPSGHSQDPTRAPCARNWAGGHRRCADQPKNHRRKSHRRGARTTRGRPPMESFLHMGFLPSADARTVTNRNSLTRRICGLRKSGETRFIPMSVFRQSKSRLRRHSCRRSARFCANSSESTPPRSQLRSSIPIRSLSPSRATQGDAPSGGSDLRSGGMTRRSFYLSFTSGLTESCVRTSVFDVHRIRGFWKTGSVIMSRSKSISPCDLLVQKVPPLFAIGRTASAAAHEMGKTTISSSWHENIQRTSMQKRPLKL